MTVNLTIICEFLKDILQGIQTMMAQSWPFNNSSDTSYNLHLTPVFCVMYRAV